MANKGDLHVRQIFQEAQTSSTTHDKLRKQLSKLYDQMDKKVFLEEFTTCLKVPFMKIEKHPIIENSLSFAVKFLSSLSSPRALRAQPDNDAEEDDAEAEEIHPFVVEIFNVLFKYHNVENQVIRYRVCEFINRLLNSFGNDAHLEDEICDQISVCMMERLKDRSPNVRSQALLALFRLQDPTVSNCNVINVIAFHMERDPSMEVRKMGASHIAHTTVGLRAVFCRINDIKEKVRRAAFAALAEVNVARFSIKHRVHLLTSGLKDDSKMVRACVRKTLIPNWLSVYKGDILTFLHALDSENATETCTLVLQCLFEDQPINNAFDQITNILDDNHLIPVENLTAENALFWKVLHEHVEANPDIAENRPFDASVPNILPELSVFCKYIRLYFLESSTDNLESWVKLQREYILKQLLEITKSFDFSDEVGRSNLRQLCLDLLKSERVGIDVIALIVKVLVKVIPDVDSRLQTLAEAISDMRDSLEADEPEPEIQEPQLSVEERRQRELKIAAVRVKILEKEDERDEAVKTMQFNIIEPILEEWKELKRQLDELSRPTTPRPPSQPQVKVLDPVMTSFITCKCLKIVKEMLQSETVTALNPTLRSLMHNFIMPCLVQEDNSPEIRSMALEALGIFSLLDISLAKQHFVMFCFHTANDDVCEKALKATFDLLLTYGLETFKLVEGNDSLSNKLNESNESNGLSEVGEEPVKESSDSNKNAADVIALLTSFLDSTSSSMRYIALDGFYKLLMTGRISSYALLSRLIILWYSPVSEDDEKFRQSFGIFLPHYAFHSAYSQETLEKAFLPTLRTLNQAPSTSPISMINPDKISQLFISLTMPGTNKLQAQKCHIHNNMAVSLCNEMLNNIEDADFTALLRALLQLHLSFEDPVYREELLVLCKEVQAVCQSLGDSSLKKYICKFMQRIKDASNNTVQSLDLNNTAATSSRVHDSRNPEQNVRRGQSNRRSQNHLEDAASTDEEMSDDDSKIGDNTLLATGRAVNLIIPQTPPGSESSSSDDDVDGHIDEEVVFKKPAQAPLVKNKSSSSRKRGRSSPLANEQASRSRRLQSPTAAVNVCMKPSTSGALPPIAQTSRKNKAAARDVLISSSESSSDSNSDSSSSKSSKSISSLTKKSTAEKENYSRDSASRHPDQENTDRVTPARKRGRPRKNVN